MKREHLMDKFDVQEKNTSDSAWENSFLTEHEKILEDQTCRNHQDLTAFFRLISGVDQKTAEENIRRISQVIPREVLNGVSLYFNGGKYAARYLSDYELRMQYAYGVHACGISFFDVHKRYPRQLAVEHNWFSEKALLKIEEDKCVFSLRTRDSHNTEEKIFWYRDKKEWKQAKKEDDHLEVPMGCFQFTFFPAESIVEAECLVAYTESKEGSEQISEKGCRELNIHIW